MPNLEVIEKYFLALCRGIQRFASRSRPTAPRRLFFITLVGVGVAAISVFSFNGLMWYVNQESAQRNKVYISKIEGSRIDRAIGAVSSCSKEKEKQSVSADFYCNEAIWRYKSVMGRYEISKRVTELVKNKAYEAMQLDMRQHLQDVEAATLRDAETFPEKVFAEFSELQWQLSFASLVLMVYLMASWAMYRKR